MRVKLALATELLPIFLLIWRDPRPLEGMGFQRSLHHCVGSELSPGG